MIISDTQGSFPQDDFTGFGDQDTLKTKATVLLHSPAYSFFYLIMILLNAVLVGWIIFNTSVLQNIRGEKGWIFMIVEILVNVGFILEIFLHWLSQRHLFWRSPSNLFDLAVCILSVVGITSFAFGSSFFLVFFRYAVQFLRLVPLIKNQQYLIAANRSRVDFSSLEEEVGEEMDVLDVAAVTVL
eukprot:TRINITY_DN6106_c0_g1_i1.p2 TRINITY_DN6106_c0_g1~~TRINITY_DN6106_c0_g1_i1.p2  ORF type:complete len:185 (-),score=31.17 TRINITY_DN6106_c0_g1_i1:637-1191(-)